MVFVDSEAKTKFIDTKPAEQFGLGMSFVCCLIAGHILYICAV